MIESFLVIMTLCIILFGLMQVSYLVAAKDVISFSAFAACRSATVGLKDEVVDRVARTTSIPMAGPFVGELDTGGLPTGGRAGQAWDSALQSSPSSDQYWMEHHAIPYYIGARDEADLPRILNYYNWVNGNTRITSSTEHTDYSVLVYVRQNVPLTMPFAHTFYRGNIANMTRRDGTTAVPRSPIDAELEVEDHSALYLYRP